MDSKNIYITCQRMIEKISWENGDNIKEWRYVGKDDDFKDNENQSFINSFFEDKELYLIIGRHDSLRIPIKESALQVKNNLSEQHIVLSNKDFSRMIEFSTIGSARCGKITA